MKITIGTCPRCGRHPWMADLGAGVTLAVDPERLEMGGVIQAAMGGIGIWALGPDGSLKPVRERGAARCRTEHLVAEHSCGAPAASVRAFSERKAPEVAEVPKGRPAGVQTPSWAPQTESSGARSAEQPPSEPLTAPLAASHPVPGTRAPRGSGRPGDGRTGLPVCSACSTPCADGTYASIQVGELYVWAQHLEACAGA